MNTTRPLTILTAALAAAFLFACGSAPQATKPAPGGEAPPAWVLNPPEADAQYMYFVGSGESKTGSMAEGEEFARGALIDEIMRYLGVRISSEPTATAKTAKTAATQTSTPPAATAKTPPPAKTSTGKSGGGIVRETPF